MYSTNHLQQLYASFCKTPLLWKGADIGNLPQLEIENYHPVFLRKVERYLRLGQLAEQFVFNQLETSKSVRILAENKQIQNERKTVGELDAIIKFRDEAVHLEIVYKFFLYDDTITASGLQNWIGPNRKDSLNEKLNKLSEKQLPLLYSGYCQDLLETLNLCAEDLQQQVLFKAQLFTPFNQDLDFGDLNPDCHQGFYFRLNQLEEFKNHEFHIPPKIDWLLEAHTQADWLAYEVFIPEANRFLKAQKAPMFWMRNKNGELTKAFLVWW